MQDMQKLNAQIHQKRSRSFVLYLLVLALLGLCCVLSLGLSACSQATKTESPEKSDQAPKSNLLSDGMQTDVLVIGAGTTGLTAAVNAHDQGAKVIVVEKMPAAGGNSARAEGGMNAAGTKFQKEQNIQDSPQIFFEDTMKGGHDRSNPEILNYFTQHSAAAIDWLTEQGMDVSEVAQAAGARAPRMHRPQGGQSIGAILVKKMLDLLEQREIPVYTNQKAVKLLSENNKIIGAQLQDEKTGKSYTIKADAVILTTGGFGANQELITKYRPDLKGFGTTNHPGALGDGIKLAEEIGADTIDMDQIQTNPTVEPSTLLVLSESLRGNGAIFVNTQAQRFANEMETRDFLSNAILKQDHSYAWEIFDQGTRERMKATEKYFDAGIVLEAASYEELAQKMEIDPAIFSASMKKWNESVAQKKDPEFGRSTALDYPLDKGPFYAIKVAPAVHYTMGGIKIDDTTAVINKEGARIEGLFAAGETTGGLHGGNRLGGNAVADTVIFGKRSGEIAAEFALKNGSLFNKAEQSQSFKAFKDSLALAKPKEGAAALYKDGTYKGKGTGKEGLIELEVKVENGFITQITTLSSHDTPSLYSAVETELFPKVIEEQNLEIDGVSGSTLSSQGVKEALNNALKDARKQLLIK